MRIVGLTASGEAVFRVDLEHGSDPAGVAYDLGYVLVRPIDAARDTDRELELSLLVRPAGNEPPPKRRWHGRESGLELGPGVVPQQRQRVACYAIVTSGRGLLATELSNKTGAPGRWGLPGGGIDPDEEPHAAVLREVAEETDQTVVLGDLIRVQTQRWVGRSPRDRIEDYQAVRLVYRADCPEPTTPRVLDVGGTTESARWIEIDNWRALPWTSDWRAMLADELGPRND